MKKLERPIFSRKQWQNIFPMLSSVNSVGSIRNASFWENSLLFQENFQALEEFFQYTDDHLSVVQMLNGIFGLVDVVQYSGQSNKNNEISLILSNLTADSVWKIGEKSQKG